MMGRILSDRRYNGESSQIQCHVSGKLGNNDEVGNDALRFVSQATTC